jgi:ABC-type multidrug transport system fused ATPase/permease subunit
LRTTGRWLSVALPDAAAATILAGNRRGREKVMASGGKKPGEKVPVTSRTLYSWVLEKNGRWQLLLVVMVVVTVGLRVVSLEMQKRIINKAIGMGDAQALLLYSFLFLGAVVLASSLKFGINFLQSFIGQETLQRMRVQLYAHILSLPISFFRTIQPGQVVNGLINELTTVSTFIGSAVSVPLINLCTLLAMGGYLFYLNPLLAVLSFVLYPLQVAIIPRLQKRNNIANRYRIKISREISGNIGEVLTGIHEVHGHAAYRLEEDKFSDQSNEMLQANVRMNAYRYGIKFANNLFENMGPFILFLVGGTMTIRGHFDLGALVAFLSAYSSLSEPWRELMDFYQLHEDSRVRYQNVVSIFARQPDYLLVPVARDVYRLRGSISVQGMTMQAEDGTILLDNVSLEIHPGEMVALVGFSGSGKSCLVQVVVQLYPYFSGSVKIDAHEVRDLSKLDLATNIGFVPQHPFIFSGTIRDNLLYSCVAGTRIDGGNKGLPDLDRIVEVIQQVGLFPDILRFAVQATIDPNENSALITRILSMRRSFRERFGEMHGTDIEFFDPDIYLEFGTVAQNIIFGELADGASKDIYGSSWHRFLSFLDREQLTGPLIEFGAVIVLETVPILQYAAKTSEIFAESPISAQDFERCVEVAATLRTWGTARLPADSREFLCQLALGFIPGKHKTVVMPKSLRAGILKARADLPAFLEEAWQRELQRYDLEQYAKLHSIRDNILFGQLKGQRAGIVELINQNLVQLLIEEGVLEQVIEQGLNFQVGSMGENLSGGQRQKIALARVLLRQPAIYILDEATSALDNASQARMQNLLEILRGRHTILSVVHRLDTIKNYDRVLVMKAGKIVESGAYQELMAAKGVLYGLVKSA